MNQDFLSLCTHTHTHTPFGSEGCNLSVWIFRVEELKGGEGGGGGGGGGSPSGEVMGILPVEVVV